MFLISRRIMGVALVFGGLVQLYLFFRSGNSEAFIKGMFGLVVGMCCLGRELVEFAGAPLISWVSSLYMPSHASGRPPLTYRLADTYMGKEMYDLALEEYLRIIEHHPKEVAAYVSAIAILSEHENDPDEALSVGRRGLRRIKEPEKRQAIEAVMRKASPDGIPLGFDQPSLMGNLQLVSKLDYKLLFETKVAEFKEWLRSIS